MKIPDDVEEVCYDVWTDAARKLSMIYGVYIGVDVKYVSLFVNHISEINFTIGDNKFGSLKELRRALKMKALL